LTTPSETEEIDDEELNQSTDRHMEYKNNDNTEELMTKSYNEGVFGCSPTYKQLGGVFAIMIILVVVMVLLIKNKAADSDAIDDKYFSCNITSYVKVVGDKRKCFNCDTITPKCEYCADDKTCTSCATGYILNATS